MIQIENFLDMMTAERASAKNTLEAYKNDLHELNLFLVPGLIQNADIQDLRKYINQLSKKYYSSKTISRKISAIKQFYQFLYLEKIIQNNPANLLELPKKESYIPKKLSKEDIEVIISKSYQDKTIDGIRNSAMIELLYASGMRVSELISLKFSNLQFERSKEYILKPYLIIIGKGNKERMVIINNQAIQAITEYLKVRSKFTKHNNDHFLFPSNSKEGHMTRQRFGQLLKVIAIKANIDPDKVSPHVIRHSFASHLLAGGADLRVIQELLGHADIATTQIYTHIEDEKLKSVILKHHPLAKRNK